MSANTFTLEAAAAANIQLVGSDKGSQAVHDLIAVSYTHLDVYKRQEESMAMVLDWSRRGVAAGFFCRHP